MSTKTPKLESAAATARVVSRLLRQAGFQMVVVDERGRWSAGYRVHRIGYSGTVSVYWRCEDEQYYKASHKQERRERLDAARQFLSERGYPIDHIGYIECEGE